jgi:hypothetical protein
MAGTKINELIDNLNDALAKERLKGYFGTPDSTEKIELFEKAFGVMLPNSYKIFLRNFDGGFIADKEADNLILIGEFEEAKNLRTRFLSIDEIIDEYGSMDIDDWNLPPDFEGFYPYIPFCITGEDNEKLVFTDNHGQNGVSKVFAGFHDTPASGWFVAADNFTGFLENFLKTGGKPDLYGNDSDTTAEDLTERLNK